MADIDFKALEQAGFSKGERNENDDKRVEMEAARSSMLKSILTPEARERLHRVALVKPENAKAVEEHLIRLARSGKLAGAVDESTVIKMLEDVSKLADKHAVQGGAVKKVIIQRRKGFDDDDDDDDDDF